MLPIGDWLVDDGGLVLVAKKKEKIIKLYREKDTI